MNTAAVDLSSISPSSTNPRRTFDQAALDELTESVRRHGVIQPILLRPNPSLGTKWELVAGERRCRAAQAAGLTEIPALVRELTDAEVLEIQVIENLQRADLLPLEEAEGYASLMKCAHQDGRPYTAEEIAAKIGKSKAYVYARLKLSELCEEAKKALAEGEITVSVGELIARIPGDAQQAEALKQVSDKWGAPMSFKDARDFIHRHFMLQLDRAPFDVKAIYEIHAKSGNPYEAKALPKCGDCPKRTGNSPDLFPDVKAKDTCTDPSCYETKCKAVIVLKVEEHRAAGREVIVGAAAKKILGKWESSSLNGYVRLDARCDEDEKGRNWRAALGKACPEPVLVENIHKSGEFIEVVPAAAAREALLKKRPAIAERKAQEQRERAKDERANELEREIEWQVYLALRELVGREGFTNVELREIVLDRLGDYDTDLDDRLLPYWGVMAVDALGDRLDNEQPDLAPVVKAAEGGVLLQMLFDVLAGCRYRNPEFIDVIAKARGIDRKAIERQVKAELKAKAKAVIVNSVGEPMDEEEAEAA